MEIYTILNKNKRKIIIFSSFIFSLTLLGCNTIEGAGTDIKHGGKALERAAESNKQEPPACCPYCARPITCRKY